MVKFFCDICNKEAQESTLDNVKILIDNKYHYWAACNNCRKRLSEYILKIKGKKPKFKVGDIVKYKTGHISYIVFDVKELNNTGYCYDLYRQFYDKPHNRDYKITGILESRLEGAK